MAYGFEFSKNGGTITLNKTHDGMHLGKQILRLNGVDITILSGTEVDRILQSIAERKEIVSLLLESGELVNFCHNSIPDGIWMREDNNPILPEWKSHRDCMEASEDGKVIVAGKGRPGTQALKTVFPY